MRIAEYIDTCDTSDSLRSWFVDNKPEVLELLATEEARVNKQKEKRGGGGEGVTGISSQTGLRRRRKKKVGEASDGGLEDGGSSKSPVDTSDPLEKVGMATHIRVDRQHSGPSPLSKLGTCNFYDALLAYHDKRVVRSCCRLVLYTSLYGREHSCYCS